MPAPQPRPTPQPVAQPVAQPLPPPAPKPIPPPAPEPAVIFTPPPAPKPVGAPAYIPEYPAGTYAPPPQSPRYPNQESANLGAYLRPVQPQQAPQTVNRIPPPFHNPPTPRATPPVPAQRPQAPRVTDAAHMLEDHEEPHIDLGGAVRRALATAPEPAREPLTVILPPDFPPVRLPGQMPPSGMAEVRPSLRPNGAPAPRPYGVDPYHEPIDEGPVGS